MSAINQILVPIDFSETSGRVLELGRTLADACGASLHLLHLVKNPLSGPETAEQERLEAGRRLDALLDDTDRERRHARTSCEVGTPAFQIVNYAGRHDIDLIVMGTHRHGPTFQMATGSVAEIVLGSAPCAVLAVKGAEPRAWPSALDPIPAAVAG